MVGVVLIDKPQDFTSFDAVAVLRRILNEKRLGHTGTLDPMATGILPILVGRATRLCDIMPISDKRYIAEIKLGLTTDTYDITGNVLSESKVDCNIDIFSEALKSFVGDIVQYPPMYSAVSVGGKRLYELARKGIEVERPSRNVTVYSADILEYDDKEHIYKVDIACSKGTYIRSIAHDIGEKLGCGGVLTSLRRTNACGFDISNAISIEDARNMSPEQLITSLEPALLPYNAIRITEAQSFRLQ
ncbi:MAG: tRNA pseudouridine(55) synthase TruB, partial [Clostridia bacterium]|nr:tRNA pseudouridine(55) synthase TruB [Clostridia bacterium]